MNPRIEESLVDGYQVWLVNDCGEQMVLLGTVAKQQDRQLSATCCDESWYSLYLALLTAPSDAASLAIVPFRGSQLHLPSFLPIMQRTIATTSTTTTVAGNMKLDCKYTKIPRALCFYRLQGMGFC